MVARSVASGVARGVAKPITVASGGGAAALDIRAQVGTSTAPLTATTSQVTGVGFQPKAVLGYNVQHTASAATTVALLSLGAAVSTSSRAAIAVSSNNAVTTSATNRRHTNAGMLTGLNATGAVQTAADLASMDAGGFTRSFSAVSGAADILNHICLGGADLEVSLTQQQMNGTNAAQSFAHGLSGAPTGVLFFTTWNATAPANTTTGINCGIGAWAGGNQFDAFGYSQNGVTTSNTGRRLSTSTVVSYFGSGKTLFRSMAVSSVDATNVNVTYPVTVDNSQAYFFMLAIRGAKCQVGTFNTASSNTIATTGLTPKLFIPVFVPSGVASAGSVLNDLCLSIGASDGTNNVSCGISDANGLTTTNARRFQSSTTLQERNTAGTVQFEATAAFSGESIVVTPTTALTNFGQAGYLALGI